MPQATVEETTLVVDGVKVFCRRLEGGGTPTVYVHGNPTHAGHWPWIDRPAVVDRVLDFLAESPSSDEGCR